MHPDTAATAAAAAAADSVLTTCLHMYVSSRSRVYYASATSHNRLQTVMKTCIVHDCDRRCILRETCMHVN